jgi:hypothetical protein
MELIIKRLSEEELVLLGCTRKDIAPYSARKGSATFATGQICGPSPIAVQLRMGHSLGKVNDPYLHQSDGADQILGRTVAMMPSHDERFAVLPPHFSHDVRERLTVDYWMDMVPGYEMLAVELKPALPYLLASLMYHEKFLEDALKPDHVLFRSRVYSRNELLPVLRGGVTTGNIYCEATGMYVYCVSYLNIITYNNNNGCLKMKTLGLSATGLPPHIVQQREINNLRTEVSALTKAIQDSRETLPNEVGKVVADDIRGIQLFMIITSTYIITLTLTSHYVYRFISN